MSHLSTDHDGPIGELHGGVSLQPVVHGDDVQDVQHLTLVLVNTFHL